MIKIARNGYYLSFFAVVLTTGILLSPFSSGAANAKKKKDKKNGSPFSSYLNKSETPSDAYDHLKEWSGVNAAEKKKRTAAEIKRWAKNKKALAAEKARSKQNMKRYKKRIQDLKLEASMNEKRNAKELKKLSKQKKNVRTKKMQSGEIVKTTSNPQQKAIERAKRKHYAKVERDLKRKRKGVLAENQSRKNRSTAQKAHAEYQLKKEKVRTKNIAKRQNAENVRHNNSKKRSFHEKANTHIGNAGLILSLIDSAKNSYYEDEKGKIHFSAPMYLKNVATNLTGISAMTGTVDAAVNANKWAYNKIIDDYKAKHKCDKVPDYVKKHAEAAALRWGGIVGAYNGAKCVPVLGDMIAVGELTEATVGLAHDTALSNRILAENKATNQKNRSSAIAKLNAKYEELKACEKEFKKLEARSDKMIVDFKSSRNQYIEVFSRSVKREKNFAAADALTKAAKTAEPYMDDKRIDSLRLNSQKMSAAVMTTIKLARTSLENQKANGDDPTVLKKTSAELATMVEALAEDKKECDSITKALNPLLNGGDIVGNTQELAKETETDSIISSDLYGTARDTLRTHRSLVHKAKLLKQTQAKILQETRALRDHFFKYGDNETKSTIKMDYKNAIRHQIDDYLIGKLEEKQKTMLFEFNGLRGATRIREGLPPEIAGQVEKAEKLAPIIASLEKTLDATMANANQMLQALNSPVQTLTPVSVEKISTALTTSNSPKISVANCANMSIDDMAKAASFAPRKTAKDGETRFGFTFHKRSSHNDRYRWDSPKSTPIYYGTYRKLLEKGTIPIWADANSNNKKDAGEEKIVPYWIWYDIGGSGVRVNGSSFLLNDPEQAKKRCYDAQWLTGKQYFIDTNVAFGMTGNVKQGASYYNSEMDGRAAFPPFQSYVRIDLVMQIGGTLIDTSEMKKTKLWIFDKSKDKILAKMAFWETGLEKTSRSLLNSTLEFPKKYTSYLKKHLSSNAYIADDIALNGFTVTYKSKRRGIPECGYHKQFERKAFGSIERETYNIYIQIKRIDEDETIKECYKRVREKAEKNFRHTYKRKTIKTCNVPGSDFSLMFSERKIHKHRYQNTIDIWERIIMVRGNVVVSVDGCCHNILVANAKMRTFELAKAVISKFRKPDQN